MDTRIIGDIAYVNGEEPIITDAQSALDLAASICYEHSVTKLIINKSDIIEGFFKLSTGLLGEVAQKFVNYHFRVAIIGDFSVYASKPLHDYIYECNKGKHLYFVADEEEAVRKLSD